MTTTRLQNAAPAAKRNASETDDQASSPAAKKLRPSSTTPPPPLRQQQHDEFDDIDDGELDEAQLLAAVEAAEAAAELASASSHTSQANSTQPSSSNRPSSVQRTPATPKASKPATTSTPKQTLLFGSKPPPSPSTQHPTITPPTDPSDMLYVERQTMDPAWFRHLKSELSKDYFTRLKQFLQSEEKAGKKTFPPAHLVHSWSRLTPLEKVKVVVVGQDPYHGAGQACGLSFSVPKGVPAPPSLKNIYKEISNEYPGFKPPAHGCLEEWAKQGVLLLNACLTVSAGNAGSHHGKGWENLTKVVLKTIAENAAKGAKKAGADATANSKIASMFANVTKKQQEQGGASSGKKKAEEEGETDKENKKHAGKDEHGADENACKGVVFMVWGQPAGKTLAEAGITDNSPNVLILRSPHPSPLSAHRGFLGNGHFEKANKWLKQRYGEGGGIDWTRL